MYLRQAIEHRELLLLLLLLLLFNQQHTSIISMTAGTRLCQTHFVVTLQHTLHVPVKQQHLFINLFKNNNARPNGREYSFCFHWYKKS